MNGLVGGLMNHLQIQHSLLLMLCFLALPQSVDAQPNAFAPKGGYQMIKTLGTVDYVEVNTPAPDGKPKQLLIFVHGTPGSLVTIAEQDRGTLTNTSRALQGQSDWLFNAQIGYEPFNGTTATLLYHYYGERISEVGIEGAPDLIEQPFGELNAVFIRELGENWRVTLKGKNLLNEKTEVTQGGLVTTGFTLGRAISLKLDYRF